MARTGHDAPAHEFQADIAKSQKLNTIDNISNYRHDVARFGREVELSVHLASVEHQREHILTDLDCRVGEILMHRPQVDGKQKVMYALTKIKGVGRRYSNLVCKKADVDLNKRFVDTGNMQGKRIEI